LKRLPDEVETGLSRPDWCRMVMMTVRGKELNLVNGYNVGNVRINCGAFAQCLYLLGYLKLFSRWQKFNVAGKKHVGLHVKCLRVLKDFDKISIFSPHLIENLQYEISQKSIGWELR